MYCLSNYTSIFYSLVCTDNTLKHYCKRLKNERARSEHEADLFLTTAVSMALELSVDNKGTI